MTYIFNRCGVDSLSIKTYKLLLTIFLENFAINLKHTKQIHFIDYYDIKRHMQRTAKIIFHHD